MSRDINPEKIATYFSSMSPLAAKIFADIQGVEESLKAFPNLSYNEKCSVVDKHLIYDLIHNQSGNKRNSYYNRSEVSLSSLEKEAEGRSNCTADVFYDDAILDQDHVSALMLSVYPKKPEKYVYDDNNYWIDEHSVSYSCCTESQAKACQLEQFVKSFPVPELKQRYTACHKKYKAPTKPPVLHEKVVQVEVFHSETENEDYNSDMDFHEDLHGNNQNSYNTVKTNAEADTKHESQVSTAKKFGIIGVSVMGTGGPPPKPPSLATKHQIQKKAQEQEENLPQQKQNSDLIAELQAKLKMNKNGASKTPSGSKINKPKAPPPPPPKLPGIQVEINNDNEKTEQPSLTTSKTSCEKSTVEKEKKTGKELSEDDFIVDISSPCRIATPKTGFDFLDNW